MPGTARHFRWDDMPKESVKLPHKALALEDTLDVDIFSPPREDWLAGTDAYLRGR